MATPLKLLLRLDRRTSACRRKLIHSLEFFKPTQLPNVHQGWAVSTGVALVRAPIIAPALTELEQHYAELSTDIECENSHQNDFELQKIKDAVLMEKRKKLEEEGKDLSELDEAIGVTAEQKESEWVRHAENLSAQWKVKVPGHDNPMSLHYKPTQKVVLLVKQQFNALSVWMLPTLKNVNETLRQTAERCLGEVVVGELNVSIDGNAPMAVYPYKFPKPVALSVNAPGNYTFVYSAHLDASTEKVKYNNEFVKDYRWCAVEDLKEIVPSAKLRGILRNVLFE